MVLYSEQTRKLSTETELVNDSSVYQIPLAYGTVHDFGSVTAPEDGLLLFNFTYKNNGGSSYNAGFVVLVDGFVVQAEEYASVSPAGTEDFKFYVPVSAGSHTIEVEGKSSNVSMNIYNFVVGFCAFSDFECEESAEYTGAVTVNCPSRNTPLGTLAYATLIVRAGAVTSGAATEFENDGESKTNGVKLKVNDAYVTWTSRDDGTTDVEGASAVYIAQVPVDTDYAITFVKDNAATDVYVSVTICPWLLTGSNTEVSTFPVVADFPPNSTLYITLEPLIEDVTSFAAIGKPRGISFGDATDYYKIAEATGINSLTYTFELVSPDNVGCYVGGYGACIAYIGVDVV